MVTSKYLPENGVNKLIKVVLEDIKSQLEAQITTMITDTSTNTKAPSAKAVYDFVLAQIAGVAHFEFKVIEWGGSLPSTGETHIVYLKPAAQDGPLVMWYYVDSAWVELGTTAIDLVDYWKKDELVPMTDEEIQAIFDEIKEA